MDSKFIITPKDIERFWEKVEKTDSCWEWTGRRDKKGYASFSLKLRTTGKFVPARGSRFAFFVTFGVEPLPLCLHRCDNPGCVNPVHLFAGTYQDNVDDMIAKGRMVIPDRRGSKGPKARLTEEIVYELRRRHKEEGVTFAQLARDMGFTRQAMRGVIVGVTWTEVPFP